MRVKRVFHLNGRKCIYSLQRSHKTDLRLKVHIPISIARKEKGGTLIGNRTSVFSIWNIIRFNG